MNFLYFLASNWDSVVVVLAAVGAIIIAISKRQCEVLNEIIFALVTEVEKQFGGNTGAAKLAAVIERLYPKIPAMIRLFITTAKLKEMIEAVLPKAKKKWENNPDLAAYVGTVDKR